LSGSIYGNTQANALLSSNIVSTIFTTGNITTIANVIISGTTPATSAVSGAMIVSGGMGVAGNIFQTGQLTVANTTGTTSAVSGAVIITGGLAVGGNIYQTGKLTVANSSASTGSGSGAVIVNGGVGIGANLNIGGNLAANVNISGLSNRAYSVGYLGIPQNTQNANYGILIGDAGRHIYVTATSTVTIPDNGSVAFPIGTAISIIANSGATVTIAITTDTMYLAGTGTTGSRTLAAFGMATAVKVTSTVWFINGTGLT
jgi:hypothetical protein